MFASLFVYTGGLVLLAALALVVKPIARIRVTRRRALGLAAVALLAAIGALMAPTFESRTTGSTRIDEFSPVWQFHEVHTLRVAAPPARVFEAIMKVRADEIRLFHTLTWIRRGGRPAPTSLLNAGSTESIIDVATRTGFVRLADDAPQELVIGTVLVAPAGTRGRLTPDVFQRTLPPGFALATMNFRVTPDGLRRIRGVDRNACVCEQPRSPTTVRSLLAADLSRQRDHQADVAGRHRAARAHGMIDAPASLRTSRSSLRWQCASSSQ